MFKYWIPLGIQFQYISMRGFTLMELMVVMALAATAALSLFAFSDGLTDILIDDVYELAGDVYYEVPSDRGVILAARLENKLLELVASASAVYCFGGINDNLGGPNGGRMPPMVGTFKPTSIVAMDGATQVAAIESFNVGSADRFRAVNAVQFSGHWESAYQDADFSLLILSGFNTVSGILQVRRILNSGRVYYNTQLHHGAGLSQTMRYGICALEDADVWALDVGAIHLWERQDAVWNREEERFNLIVLPDPGVGAANSQVQVSSSMKHLIPVTW